MVVFELGAGSFQISVVVEEMQSSKKGLRTAAYERNDLLGTEKTMPANEPEDVEVAFGELHGSNFGGAVEAWEPGGFHLSTIRERRRGKKAARFAVWGNFLSGLAAEPPCKKEIK